MNKLFARDYLKFLLSILIFTVQFLDGNFQIIIQMCFVNTSKTSLTQDVTFLVIAGDFFYLLIINYWNTSFLTNQLYRAEFTQSC